MMKGMNGDENALDDVSTLILDEYRRLMIIKKARDLNLVAVFLTVITLLGFYFWLHSPCVHPNHYIHRAQLIQVII